MQAKAGRDPAAQIRMALWCEQHGLNAEKVKHLALAVLKDPQNTMARGLLGLLPNGGRWETPEARQCQVEADELLSARLAEYNRRRDELQAFESSTIPIGTTVQTRWAMHHPAAEVAAAHAKLGAWCEQNGLKPEATAHFTQAVVLDPYRDSTWKRLGFVKHAGRWMTREQITAEEKEAIEQTRADRLWEPRLSAGSRWLKDEKLRDQATTEMNSVDRPRTWFRRWSGSLLWGTSGTRWLLPISLARLTSPCPPSAAAARRVQCIRCGPLGRHRGAPPPRAARFRWMADRLHPHTVAIPRPACRGPWFTRSLADHHASLHDAQDIRRSSSVHPQRPVLRLHRIRREWIARRRAGGRDELGGEMAALDARAPSGKLQQIEARTQMLLAEANLKAVDSQQRLIADVNDIEAANAEALALNQRITPILTTTLDAPDLKNDEDAWKTWWYDHLGYRYDPPPPVSLAVNASPQYAPPRIYSCFVAGTPVRTINGHRPIESVRVGDRLLTQDVTPVPLSFQPVMVVHHNAPARTIRVALDNGETITASTYHRFWQVGKGWAMAKQLHNGDSLRTLGGICASFPSSPARPSRCSTSMSPGLAPSSSA